MRYNYVIVGAGYSGLKQAEKLKQQGAENVLMIEFENKVGGRPWDSSVNPEAPFKVINQSKVIGVEKISDGFLVTYQNSKGKHAVETDSVMMTSGSVERERFFDFVTGDRPSGDMTAKLALNLLKRGYIPGHNPLIVNSTEYAQELIEKLESFEEVDIIEIDPEKFEVVRVEGKARVESVTVVDKSNGTEKTLSCDALIYANGILPLSHSVHEMAIDLDEDNFILTNDQGESSVAGLYAYGDVAKIKN